MGSTSAFQQQFGCLLFFVILYSQRKYLLPFLVPIILSVHIPLGSCFKPVGWDVPVTHQGISCRRFLLYPTNCDCSQTYISIVCPRCGGKHIKKFGFDSRGNQRYSCKNCGTFIPTTKTVFANSKIPAGKWLKYAECMNRKYSLRKSAEIAEVSLKTAFKR